MSKYFNEDDFLCKCGCGMDVTQELKEKVYKAREIAGVPFVVNSGARCKKHNKSVGASDTSTHTKGEAVDIGYKSLLQMTKIINAFSVVGISRIGVHSKFVHADIDKTKPSAIWDY